ncbi:MAG: acylneuraminate cytidylyltransferase family protein [Synechococcus sp.]|jgi:CMP-N-acetylneuraminic acid synthetase|nr:acylneuraminate cytidylyltransferase family protein [Synechococcus sp.]
MSVNSSPPVRIDAELAPLVLIPARGGSKGIPGKNLRSVGGVPLLARSVRAARAAASVGAIWVSSDDPAIGALGEREGAGWLPRPAEISDDRASSEAALLHALAELAGRGALPAVFVFLQCTSPFTTGMQIDAVMGALQSSQANMAFSAVPWHGFLWARDGDGHGIGVNHDSDQPRQRRQDLTPTYLETGAIYAIRTAAFLEHRTRFVPPALPVPFEGSAPEIDTAADLAACELLAPMLGGI